MGKYNIEKGEVRGIKLNGKAICLKCATDAEWQRINGLEEIINIDDLKTYICRRCRQNF